MTLYRGLMDIYCSIWNNRLRTNVDYERASFPTIRRITFMCFADHFPANTYKTNVSAYAQASCTILSRWGRVMKKRTERQKSLNTRLGGETLVSSRRYVIWTKINVRFSFEPRTKNSFIVFANAFLIRSRAFRSNVVKKINLANTKRICVASRQNAVIRRIKERYWLYSGADSYFILSAPYYRSCYRELSKNQNRN